MKHSKFIVGDAGGTKTQWRVVDGESILQFEGDGFNAYTHSLSDFTQKMHQTLGKFLTEGIPIFLYAAGVDTEEQAEIVGKAISGISSGNVQVSNDLLGVARALCGENAGNVCILGTGANACYYDGSTANKVGSSLGYILGDEGSGAYLGKLFLKEVLRDRLSETVAEDFNREFGLTAHDVIQKLYNQPRPNRFLASFAPFILKHKNDPLVYRLIISAFHDFFNAFFPHVEESEEGFFFCGSIAHYFSDILRRVAADRGFSIQSIMQSPAAGLVLYHQTYGE